MSTNPTHPVVPSFLDGSAKRLFIDGRWVESVSGKTAATTNPATGRPLALIAQGDERDIDLAVRAARRALEGNWSRWTPSDRQRLLLKLADLVEAHLEELATLDTLDMGAPITRTRGFRARATGLLRYYAAQAVSIHGETIPNSIHPAMLSYTTREPIGVVGAIIPWNAPLNASLWKIAPVLATGCALVLKPAEEAPLTPLRIAQLCEEAGVPPGVINVVTGAGETAGAALAAHRDVDKIAFTGSHATGQKIVQASAGNLKRVTLELGGKSPNIVFADADLDAAVPGAALAVFANSGQLCSAGTRLFVERSVYDEFTHRVAAFGHGLRMGDGMDPDTQIGPLVSAQQYNRVRDYLAIGTQEGATALRRSSDHLGDAQDGFFVPPTVFVDVQDRMRIAQEEIFGPVIAAIPFDDVEEVVQRANDSMFGLAGGVWTADLRKAHGLARRLKAGSVWVNCYNVMDPAVPFGGYKLSGYGRESGKQHIEEYLNVKSVWINGA